MTEQKATSTETETPAAPSEGSKRRPAQRVDAQHPLPSDRFSFAKHFPLLQNAVMRSNFGARPIDSEAMEEGVGKQAGQLNAAFFVSIGLMEKISRQYLPKEACVKFSKLLTIDEDRARGILRPVIEATWFAEAVRNCLSIKQTAGEETLMRELAIACEVSNFQAKESSFRILLHYLEWTGILKRTEDGSLSLGVSMPPSQDVLPSSAPLSGQSSVNPGTPSASVPPQLHQHALLPTSALGAVRPNDWVHKAWPGLYEVSFKPDAKALRMLKRVVEDLEIALENEEQNPKTEMTSNI